MEQREVEALSFEAYMRPIHPLQVDDSHAFSKSILQYLADFPLADGSSHLKGHSASHSKSNQSLYLNPTGYVTGSRQNVKGAALAASLFGSDSKGERE
ncbi:hypothetical protein HWV62_16298 [Athelia sp. TMB]|nr:hypothetical protein HWV62_16298 [Athelia sp. TMB]